MTKHGIGPVEETNELEPATGTKIQPKLSDFQ